MKKKVLLILSLLLFGCSARGTFEFYQGKEAYLLSGGIIRSINLHLKKISVFKAGGELVAEKNFSPDTTFDLLSLSPLGELFWREELKPDFYSLVSLTLGGTRDSSGYLVRDDSIFIIKLPPTQEGEIKIYQSFPITSNRATKFKVIWNQRNLVQMGEGYYLFSPNYRVEIE